MTHFTQRTFAVATVLTCFACSEPAADQNEWDFLGNSDQERLSETGLFSDVAERRLASGVRAFRPRFELWTDGAGKRRWVWLPDGEQIDTSDPDHWEYPLGTKFWKEFRNDERLLETRLLEKTGTPPFNWRFIAFVWNETEADAIAVPDGVSNVPGTDHDVPSEKQCRTCHLGRKDIALGFSAVQLAHDAADSLTLDSLVGENILSGGLSDARREDLSIPGSQSIQQALGQLHANCGHCHNPLGDGYDRNDMELWLRAEDLTDVSLTGAYRTAVGRALSEDIHGLTSRIVPGDPEASAVYVRMTTRGREELDMPPLGTEIVDTDAAERVFEWISDLE